MEFGLNPDTIIAIATTFAMIAAIAAGYFARKSYHQMQKQVREAVRQTTEARDQALSAAHQSVEAREQPEAAKQQVDWARVDRERAQAEAVAAWTEFEEGELVIVIENQSLTPIFAVRFATCLGTEAKPKHFYAARKSVVPPTREIGQKVNPAADTLTNLDGWLKGRPKNPQPRVDLIFKDRLGAEWHRDRDGKLHSYKSKHPFPSDWLRADGTSLMAIRQESEETEP